MAKADKDYVDSLNAIANKRMDGIENRIAIIENQSGVPAVPTEAQSASVLTITLDDLRAMVTTELTLCLKQHQERVQAEEEALKKKRAEEYEQERREAEAEGRRLIATPQEWLDLIYATQNTHFKKIKDAIIGITEILRKSNSLWRETQITAKHIETLVTPPPPQPIEPTPVTIFADLPSGLYVKIKELRNRVKKHLHTYLKGSYTFNRGYTIFVIVIYSLLMLIFMLCRISIIPR